MTTQVNQTLTNAENIFKSLVWDNFLNAELAALYTAYPYLIPFKFIISGIVKIVSNKIFNALVLFTDVTTIKLLDDRAEAAFKTESIKLQIIASNEGITSDTFIKARDAAALAQSAFTQFHR